MKVTLSFSPDSGLSLFSGSIANLFTGSASANDETAPPVATAFANDAMCVQGEIVFPDKSSETVYANTVYN